MAAPKIDMDNPAIPDGVKRCGPILGLILAMAALTALRFASREGLHCRLGRLAAIVLAIASLAAIPTALPAVVTAILIGDRAGLDALCVSVLGVTIAQYGRTILELGHGRYESARRAAMIASKPMGPQPVTRT